MSLSSFDADSAGLNLRRLQRVQRWLEEQVSNNRLNSASVLIGRGEADPFFHTAGDMQRDSVVRLFSMTKPITSVAAMMLYEQGRFHLDDPVALYLPEFADTPVWNGAVADNRSEDPDAVLDQVEAQHVPMTVHHLMTHTSGLTYGFMNATPVDAYYRHHKLDAYGSDESLSALVKRLAKAPLLAQPGAAWNYSVATDVLGRLIEIWSGKPLDVFVREHILQPLDMRETGFQVRSDQQSRFMDLYGPATGGDLGAIGGSTQDVLAAKIDAAKREQTGLQPPIILEPAAQSVFNRASVMPSGGGGLVGTIDDFATFCQMMLNGGALQGQRLLSRKTVEYMRCNHLPGNRDMAAMGQALWSETSYQGIGFGLGFAVVIDPVAARMISSVGEHHWGGAASTYFWIDPVEQLYVVFLTQLFPSSSYPLRRELRSLVYQALES